MPLHERASGLLAHPTSLPGPHGCGDLGPASLRFLEQLVEGGQRWWQMLPVGPTGYGNSPYSATSAFAGNPLLISPDLLVSEELLVHTELDHAPDFGCGRVDFAQTGTWRESLLRVAFQRFEALPQEAPLRRGFALFHRAHRAWVDDYALYAAIKAKQGLVEWTKWPLDLRLRKERALSAIKRELALEVRFRLFEQFLFDLHWRQLKEACARRGVGLIGDLPIFVAHDSADVWAHPELFQLDAQGDPTVVAGVPPDYFSRTGQRWGNPLYDWKAHRATSYAWWTERFRLLLSRFDAVRLDHFIGFQRNWEIPADEPTAVNGRWVPGPGAHFFQTISKALGELPLIAEDLGAVTPEVTALRERFGFPGLRILQFAFGTDPQAPTFKPHNYPRNTVVYTGTHDNDTTVGWWEDPGGEGSARSAEQVERERQAARAYLGLDGREINWAFIRAVTGSVADLSIVPLQDVVGLGNEARMNRPGVGQGNWEWRLAEGQLTPELLGRLAQFARLYDRKPPERLPVVEAQPPVARPIAAVRRIGAAARKKPTTPRAKPTRKPTRSATTVRRAPAERAAAKTSRSDSLGATKRRVKAGGKAVTRTIQRKLSRRRR